MCSYRSIDLHDDFHDAFAAWRFMSQWFEGFDRGLAMYQ